MTVSEALAAIRSHGLGERIIYFYVADDDDRLVGVVPTRRLLTAAVDAPVADIMIAKVIAIPHTATLAEACEFFVLHKFLAFPVVDENRVVRGIVDVELYTKELFDLADVEQAPDTLFESLGFHISQLRGASPLRSFRFRFPWLLATIAGGTLCAILTSVFETTLAKSLVLAFFLALVLGLAESISIQSLTLTIQALRSSRPSLRGYLRALRREMLAAILLGIGCGSLVGIIVFVWHSAGRAGLAIGSGIFLAAIFACGFGVTVPTLLHALKLDPKVAAGPIVLALTDICTLLFYFTLAALIL